MMKEELYNLILATSALSMRTSLLALRAMCGRNSNTSGYSYLQTLKQQYPKLILCGDYNIAHTEMDIHDPKGNKNTSGFLPNERAWMDKFIGSGWIDTFRAFHPEPQRYSWWSQRFPTVRLQNKGWRLDYITATEPLRARLKGADIYADVKHSDHCPVYLELQKQ